MEKTIKLLSYKEVLTELELSTKQNHLLLGNGFNLNLGINTRYANILERMKKENKEYEIIEANLDLEEFIGICKRNIKSDSKYSDFMKIYFNNKVKKDFMKAITSIISDKVNNIYEEKCDGIYLLLNKFTNYFTLNYDPFLYQLLLTFKKEEKEISVGYTNTLPGMEELLEHADKELLDKIRKADKEGSLEIKIDSKSKKYNFDKMTKSEFSNTVNTYFKKQYTKKQLERAIDILWKEKTATKAKYINKIDDGCRLFDDELTYIHPDTQNVFSLHGSFYLYKKNEKVFKIKQKTEEALYKQLEKIVDTPDEKILCVFTDKNKLDEIKKEPYLMNGYNKLSTLDGSLVIIGVSFSENDSHIFSQIEKSNISIIYISSCENEKENDMKKAKNFFPNKRIVLFDRDTLTYEKVLTSI